MKGNTMNEKITRRVKAGSTPPDDLPVQFAPGHEASDDDFATDFVETLLHMAIYCAITIALVLIAAMLAFQGFYK